MWWPVAGSDCGSLGSLDAGDEGQLRTVDVSNTSAAERNNEGEKPSRMWLPGLSGSRDWSKAPGAHSINRTAARRPDEREIDV